MRKERHRRHDKVASGEENQAAYTTEFNPSLPLSSVSRDLVSKDVIKPIYWARKYHITLITIITNKGDSKQNRGSGRKLITKAERKH